MLDALVSFAKGCQQGDVWEFNLWKLEPLGTDPNDRTTIKCFHLERKEKLNSVKLSHEKYVTEIANHHSRNPPKYTYYVKNFEQLFRKIYKRLQIEGQRSED